jgi:hypothetical protein
VRRWSAIAWIASANWLGSPSSLWVRAVAVYRGDEGAELNSPLNDQRSHYEKHTESKLITADFWGVCHPWFCRRRILLLKGNKPLSAVTASVQREGKSLVLGTKWYEEWCRTPAIIKQFSDNKPRVKTSACNNQGAGD